MENVSLFTSFVGVASHVLFEEPLPFLPEDTGFTLNLFDQELPPSYSATGAGLNGVSDNTFSLFASGSHCRT
jgi:hypothetical protein